MRALRVCSLFNDSNLNDLNLMATNKPKRVWETWEILFLVLVALFIGYQVGRSRNAYELGEHFGYIVRRFLGPR